MLKMDCYKREKVVKRVSHCNICKMNIYWVREGLKWVPYYADGRKDTCYKLKK